MATGSSHQHHQPLHFVLVPWLAQGHMIPMVDIARLLSLRPNVEVTIITTPVNATRIQPTIDRITTAGIPIKFVPLRFPATEMGLPEGCENLDSLPSVSLAGNFFYAAKLMRDPLLNYLRELPTPPSCMIGHPWTHTVALELGIPRFIFHGYNAFSVLAIHNLNHFKTHETVADSDLFLLPNLPHRVEITRLLLPRPFHSDFQFSEISKETRDGELTADGFVVNSFDELEPGYCETLEKATGKKAWMIGPVSLYNKEKLDMGERGNKASVDETRCITWLDSKDPKSVIYVSFGSIGSFRPSQLMELGLGLLASGRPFIWVIKQSSEKVESWLSEKFEDESRCLLIKGWAPQVVILSHPAVGGFLTHCGWNSLLESVCAGVPMVTWPMFAEQFLNEKLIVEILGIGVSLGVMKTMEWLGGQEGEEDIVVVRWEEVAEGVKRLMGGGEEGEETRRRAEELGKKARVAFEEGGSSHLDMTLLLQYVSSQAFKNGKERGEGNGCE